MLSRMRANGDFSDASVERLHSVSMNGVMIPIDAVDLESPLVKMKLFYVISPVERKKRSR